MNSLLQYDWPGNVRELENCIERAIALGNRKVIDTQDLPPSLRSISPGVEVRNESGPVADNLEDLERETIRRVFEQAKGDKVLAGRMLGISRATLYRKLKRYNIETLDAKPAAVGSPN